MKSALRAAIVFGSVCAAAAAFAATAILPPPATLMGNTVDTIWGVKVADPYRWLENSDDPKVQAWSDAQNKRTRAYLDALPDRTAVKDELTKLIKETSPAYYHLEARGARVFAYYSDPKFQQPMLVTLDASADPASRKTVLDPNKLDAKGLTAMDWFVPSGDGTKVAVSLSQNGSENGTLHVYDVASGKEIDTPIPRVQYPTAGGSLAWAADGKGFWYTRYPSADAPKDDQAFYMQVYFHKLGTDAKNDKLVLGKADGLERISEIFLDNRFNLDRVMAMVQRGDGNIWAFYVLGEGQAPVRIGTYEDDIVYATFGPDGAVYAISQKNAPNRKILKLKPPFAEHALASAPVIVPESKVAILSGGAEEQQADLSFSPGHLFVRDIVGGPNDVRIFDLDGKAEGLLPLPEVSGNSEIDPLANGDVLYDVSTYVRPIYFMEWTPSSGKAKETGLKMTSPVSYADAKVVLAFATSKDGTKVPVDIIMKKSETLDGTNPALLYGYGGYGISQTPYFLGATWRLWLDAGGIFAVANIRGGGEYGERWHKEGMLTRKQNVFDDFDAAGEYLVDKQYTSHDKLALLGGSNGGLLMGAEITQHPDLARAVVSEVGIYDMIRVELDPNGAFNTTEFGTVKNEADFKALYAYSPYHHVTKGTAYPAVLMMTGATDMRVNPMQSRKMTAALQAATGSDRPILLRTNKTSGHGIGSSLDERIAERTDFLTFLFDQLGMKFAAMKAQ
ncbi:MAG TPA: prolyl oligopeptidase family serine peptidase [Rhizomicrobium sp.]|nr:prolyl oligopeptidase family serine peptidase [Rhizomicrobium sp.]